MVVSWPPAQRQEARRARVGHMRFTHHSGVRGAGRQERHCSPSLQAVSGSLQPAAQGQVNTKPSTPAIAAAAAAAAAAAVQRPPPGGAPAAMPLAIHPSSITGCSSARAA